MALWRYIMFRITYACSKVDRDHKLIGTPFTGYVDGETVKQVNDAFHSIIKNHDSTMRIGFIKIEEIKEHYRGDNIKIKDDVTLQDVRHYGDLLNRVDWVYDRQNHSLQDWYYQGEYLKIKMVDGQCIYIEKLDK